MIRILLPLAMAAAAFLGVWTGGVQGYDLAGPTISCFIDMEFSVTGGCAPVGSLAERLVGYTVVAGFGAAVVSILGLIRFIGRFTSLAVLLAGGLGLTASGLMAQQAFAVGTPPLQVWGLWATLVLAVLTVFVAISGLRGRGGEY